MTSFDAWAPPSADGGTAGWQAPRQERIPGRFRQDVPRSLLLVVATVLAGAPVGLIWSALAPHYTVVFDNGDATYPDIESSKAFIGADGTFVLAMVAAGLLTGLAAWFLARRSGPWTVVALAVGGALAALVAMRVGLLPGRQEAFEAISRKRGAVDLFLGVREGDSTHLRAQWAFLFWPATALVVFLVGAIARPEQVD